MMDNAQSYPYTALPPGHIRLFRVNSDFCVAGEGSLHVVPLDQAPHFCALSHSWGTQSRDTVIQIDGFEVQATSDLAAGIQRLRELAAAPGGLNPSASYVWIDYLCINQHDSMERSSQVALMKEIYSRSERTAIWLGPDQYSASDAWQLIDQIYFVFRHQNPNAENTIDIPVKSYSETCHVSAELPGWDDRLWSDLRRLMGTRWFLRIWVIQEVVLSSKDPIILHGKHIFSWECLAWAVGWLRRNGYINLAQIPETLRNVDTISNLRRTRSSWPLDALLSITQIKFHGSDQRDKVYGLLALTEECQHGAELPEALRPDYSLTVAQAYRKVAVYLLRKSRSLALLTRAYGLPANSTRRKRVHDIQGLPSWAPDWSDFRVFNRDIHTSLSWVHYMNPTEPPQLGYARNFDASAGHGLELHTGSDDSVLLASGIILATIGKVIVFNEVEMSREDFKKCLQSKLRDAWTTSAPVLSEANNMDWITQFVATTTAEQHALIGRTWEQSLTDGAAYLLQSLQDEETQVALPFQESRESILGILKRRSIGDKDVPLVASQRTTPSWR